MKSHIIDERTIISESDLEDQLQKTKEQLFKTTEEKEALQKAIWDMLNYANMFVLLLDKKLTIKLINYSLAVKLGFNDEKEPLGKCWLDFIKKDEQAQISAIHYAISREEEGADKYREVISDIVKLNGKVCRIKWFNTSLNHHTFMTFSFGIPKEVTTEVTEESIRSYYTDIIEKDKTMIRSLRDSILKELQLPDTCNLENVDNLDFTFKVE